jgi:hypothetical protein
LDDQLGHALSNALSNALSKTGLHVCSNTRILNGERAHLRMAGISSLLNLLLQFLELTLKMCVSMLNLYLSISPSGK